MLVKLLRSNNNHTSLYIPKIGIGTCVKVNIMIIVIFVISANALNNDNNNHNDLFSL